MKKIGGGLQFNVYDLRNKTILRKQKPLYQQFLKYLSWCPWMFWNPFWIINKIKMANQDATQGIRFFIRNKKARFLAANIRFQNHNIIQDKVTPIKKIIGKDFDTDKKIINNYSKFIYRCWEHGFADKVYNFQLNNGINKKDEIVLMDIGELFFKKEEIIKDIKNKTWLKKRGYKILSKKSKKYYKTKMNEVFTLDNLDRYWKK